LCAGGLLALSYQGWRDDPSAVTAMTKNDQTVSIQPREAVSTPPAAVQQPAAPAQQQPQPPAESAAPETAQAPSFDIVRIEQDGSAVLAGRAAPGATVTALLNGEALGEAVANERGEWVIVPDAAIKPGAHEVTLSQAGPDGTVVASEQSVALTVPDQPGTQPLIVLSEAAKPSRVLQKPEAETAPAEAAKPAEAEEKVAAVEPSQPAASSETAATEPAQQPVTEQQAAPEPAPTVTASRSLTVDVVDYDAEGRTTFSGKAAPGSRVRVYVSGRFTGEASADAAGTWSITPTREIEAGTHALRADLIGQDGKVGERIELPFLRESPDRIAGLQTQRAGEAPATEPATQEQAPQQPATGEAGVAQQEQASAEPKQEEAVPQPQGPGRVVIQPGNNLWQISRVIYGQGIQYTVIYEANKGQIRDPDLIYPGQILDTPGSNPPESIDPDCRKPLAECKEEAKQDGQAAQ
jgi:nucleoid-associated protein YgaU